MDRVTGSMTSRTVLADVERVYGRLAASQEELSSGKRIEKPSDDPFGTSRALLYRSALAANDQFQANAGEAGAWLETTDAALSSLSDDLRRVRELVVQGANGSLSQTDRDAIAAELDQLAESVKSAANARYAGSYVLAGTKTDTAPFAVGGSDAYAGDGGAIAREIGDGVTLTVNVTGDTVVSPILAAIRQAATDLRTGGTPGNLGTVDLRAIDAAADTLAETQATVGAREARVASATARLQQLREAQARQLSETEDADVAQAMVEFSQQSAVYQAALRAGASLIQPTLMDFLSP
ncbi:MAG TPA: flagellar hook-associated protein FlgL [Gaiellaceae bacterium]|nr:flagellar hook-associated protein FlgL [Gaiellaceae bacterium]